MMFLYPSGRNSHLHTRRHLREPSVRFKVDESERIGHLAREDDKKDAITKVSVVSVYVSNPELIELIILVLYYMYWYLTGT